MITMIMLDVIPVTLVILSVPLLLNRVPPNEFYGYRTARVMNSPELWYRVNRFLGAVTLVAGIVSGILTVVVVARDPQLAGKYAPPIQIAVLLGAGALTWIYASVAQRGSAAPAVRGAARAVSARDAILALIAPVSGFAISVPLLLNEIPPNTLYGYRTSATLTSPQLWYQANHVLGWAVFAASVVAGVLASLVLTKRRVAMLYRAVLFQVAFFVVAIVVTWGYVRTL